MKKLLMLLLVIASVSAQAAPRGGFDRGDRGPGPGRDRDFGRRDFRGPPPRTEVHHHHNDGPDWLGPALILGTAAVIISSQNRAPEREVIVVREEPPVRVIKNKTVWEKIEGSKYYSLETAKKSWKQACMDWKDEMEDRYMAVDSSCGSVTCVTTGKTQCYSSARAEVSY